MECSELQFSANYRCRLLLAVIVTTVPFFAVAETGSPRPATGTKPGVAKAVASKPWSVRWQPALLVNGAPVVFDVAPPARLTHLSGKWLGHEVWFSYDQPAKPGTRSPESVSKPALAPTHWN